LSGLVERVTYHNPESGFCVLRVKARGQRDLVAVVGHAAAINAGEFISATGWWATDRDHGLQFKATSVTTTQPTTLEGIEKYLGSGMIRGIGPVYARALVGVFGDAVFDLIEQEPARLREVTGIGAKRAARIVAGWADQKAIREIMLFLHAHGVGTSRAVRIYKTYGQDAIALITENPYRLARDIRGIGFRTADQVASRLGVEREAMIRVRAGLSFGLAEATGQGHCGLPVAELTRATSELIEVGAGLIEAALGLELGDGELVADTVGGEACVFLAGLYRSEQAIAERLRLLSRSRPPWPVIDAGRAIPWVEGRTGLALAPSQREALTLAVGAKVLVITGSPGVGKTTLVNSVLKVLGAKGVRVVLCAPTGRAAKRLAESTGLEARTIHRLLEADPATGGFKRGEAHPLDCGLLVVDETSMVDVPLMRALLMALPDTAALLLVGDVDQLPSVGPGQVLADVIGSGAVPVVRLTEVFRQAAQSRIITNAHRINQGGMPELTAPDGSDFYFVEGGRAGGRRAQAAGSRARPGAGAVRAGPGARRAGAVPDEPGQPGREGAQRGAAAGAEPAGGEAGGAVRVDLRSGRQGHAGDQRLRARRVQRRPRHRRRPGHGGGRAHGQLRGTRGGVRLRRAGRAGAGLCDDDPQGAGVRVSGRGDPAHDPALRHAGAQPALQRRHPRQAAGRAGRTAQGAGHGGQERRRTQAMVQAAGVACAGTGAQQGQAARRGCGWTNHAEDGKGLTCCAPACPAPA